MRARARCCAAHVHPQFERECGAILLLEPDVRSEPLTADIDANVVRREAERPKLDL